MATPTQFQSEVKTFTNFYLPLIAITCANCEYPSLDPSYFVNPTGDKTVCIECDSRGLFVCKSCNEVHYHETNCRFFQVDVIADPRRLLNGFSYSKANPVEIINHIYDTKETFLPDGAICPKCDAYLVDVRCAECGLIYPF